MKIYVVWEIEDGGPVGVYWTHEQAKREAYVGCFIKPVDLAPLGDLVDEYFAFRTYKTPSAQEAFLFLTSELGELADELAHGQGGWVRNNPADKGKGLEGEIGDVLMMLIKLASTVNMDPLICMDNKMRSKGFSG